MTTPAHYPHSGTYLRQKMARASYGLIKLTIYATSAAIMVTLLVWLFSTVTGG